MYNNCLQRTQGDDPKDSVEVIKSVIPQFKAGTEAALRSVVSMHGSVSEVSKKFGLGCGKYHSQLNTI